MIWINPASSPALAIAVTDLDQSRWHLWPYSEKFPERQVAQERRGATWAQERRFAGSLPTRRPCRQLAVQKLARRWRRKPMTTIRQVLNQKGRSVWSIRPDATVYDAVAKMADKDIGSLVVVDDGNVLGIITERHYAREVVLKGKTSPATLVRDIMETPVIAVRPSHTVEQCMALMTDNRVRHLPVLDGRELVGLISIGDLVKSIIGDQKFQIDQLEQYIHG